MSLTSKSLGAKQRWECLKYPGIETKRDDRPGLEACLKALRPGDVLYVWKLDRLGRNLNHLVITVRGLSDQDKGLCVLTGQGANIDTTTSS
jgi:DNA invertase Pin-like site-specific DNA recombinase